VVLDTALTVNGALTVSGGALDIGGRVLTVSGDLSTTGSGVLRMVNPADTVVTLNASFAGGSTDGQLTAGRLDILGSFTQSVTGGAFRAGPAHQTWFTGALAATVTFEAPGFGADSSRRHASFVSRRARVRASARLWNGLLENGVVALGSDVAGNGQRVVSRGAEFSNLRFTNVRWQLVEGAAVTQIDSLSFLNMDPTAIAFEIVRAGGTITIPNLTFAGYSPTASGRYLRAEDIDGPTANGALTVDVTTPSPANNGGALEVVNGAIVNGWPNFAGFNWTGAVSTDWNTAGNWAENVVPSATDSVYIAPTGVTLLPAITAQTIVRSLVNDNLSPIAIDGAGTEFIVRGWFAARSDVAGAVCTTGGRLSLQGLSGTARIGGRVNCPIYYGFGEIALSANVTTDSTTDLQWISSGGNLTLNGFTLNSAGSFNTNGDGTLTMTNALDSLIAPSAGSTAVRDRSAHGRHDPRQWEPCGRDRERFDASGAHGP
jgi:hypothetical protein